MRLDQKIKPAAIRKFDYFLAWLCVADGAVVKPHGASFPSCVGIETRAQNTIPTKIPTNRPTDHDYGRTTVMKFCSIELFLRMFRMTANTCEREVVPRGGAPVISQDFAKIVVFYRQSLAIPTRIPTLKAAARQSTMSALPLAARKACL